MKKTRTIKAFHSFINNFHLVCYRIAWKVLEKAGCLLNKEDFFKKLDNRVTIFYYGRPDFSDNSYGKGIHNDIQQIIL